MHAVRLAPPGPWEGHHNCSCLECSQSPQRTGGVSGVHCCADNGATLSHGSWDPQALGNADEHACRAHCEGTPGCTHFSYSHAVGECADDLQDQSKGFGRCGLCGACSQRPKNAPMWQLSYVSYELASPTRHHAGSATAGKRGANDGGWRGGSSSPHGHHRTDGHGAPIPAMVISGCNKRYERAAAVARSAGFAPSWSVGVFRQNMAAAPGCPWPSANERNLLAAHRNAWSIIANTNVSMAVLEDDIDLVSREASIREDIHACEASRAADAPASAPRCELLYLGFVDAYWATHALYITPSAARQLLTASGRWCPEPTDYHTHRFCSSLQPDSDASSVAGWHTNRGLAERCFAPFHQTGYAAPAAVPNRRLGSHGAELSLPPPHSSELSPNWQVLRDHAGDVAIHLRPAELYGVGHFIQNRTRGYIHKQKGFTLVDSTGDGQGANC